MTSRPLADSRSCRQLAPSHPTLLRMSLSPEAEAAPIPVEAAPIPSEPAPLAAAPLAPPISPSPPGPDASPPPQYGAPVVVPVGHFARLLYANPVCLLTTHDPLRRQANVMTISWLTPTTNHEVRLLSTRALVRILFRWPSLTPLFLHPLSHSRRLLLSHHRSAPRRAGLSCR